MSIAFVVAKCAECHEPLGVGMEVTVLHPNHWRGFRASVGKPSGLEDDDGPVIVCLPCGLRIKDYLVAARVQ